jgi:hypothetical protein
VAQTLLSAAPRLIAARGVEGTLRTSNFALDFRATTKPLARALGSEDARPNGRHEPPIFARRVRRVSTQQARVPAPRPMESALSADPALVLAPEAPYPLVGGGALRTASLIQYLARTRPVDLILFRQPGALRPRLASARGINPARLRHSIATHRTRPNGARRAKYRPGHAPRPAPGGSLRGFPA